MSNDDNVIALAVIDLCRRAGRTKLLIQRIKTRSYSVYQLIALIVRLCLKLICRYRFSCDCLYFFEVRNFKV